MSKLIAGKGMQLDKVMLQDVSEYEEALHSTFKKYGINTLLRVQHFIAQIGHETRGFFYKEEIASGAAYEGRRDLGNTQPGDGKRFKGRGAIQNTGRANYTEYSKFTGIDFVSNPKLLTELPHYIDVAGWYWDKHNLNKYADKDDITTITKKINGGLNGLADRKSYLSRAKKYITILPAEAEKRAPM